VGLLPSIDNTSAAMISNAADHASTYINDWNAHHVAPNQMGPQTPMIEGDEVLKNKTFALGKTWF
jgi:hypothetical protein